MPGTELHRRIARTIVWCVVMGALIGGALWMRSRSDPAVVALAALTNPEKLATLRSKRAANPRVLKCVYWLQHAKSAGRTPEEVIVKAQAMTEQNQLHARLVRASLLRNLDIAKKLGCLTPENLERLKRGSAPMITRGPYAGEHAEVDHIVPVSHAPELDNELANLEIMPASLNRRKGAKIGARQLDYLNRFVEADLISKEVGERIRRAAMAYDGDKQKLRQPAGITGAETGAADF